MDNQESQELFLPLHCLIPIEVREDKEIPSEAKIYFGELNVLSHKFGYCFASDESLAKMKGVSIKTIERWHKVLEKRGYIFRDTKNMPTKSDDKKLHWVKKRRIYVGKEFSKNFCGTLKNEGTNGPLKNEGRNSKLINNQPPIQDSGGGDEKKKEKKVEPKRDSKVSPIKKRENNEKVNNHSREKPSSSESVPRRKSVDIQIISYETACEWLNSMGYSKKDINRLCSRENWQMVYTAREEMNLETDLKKPLGWLRNKLRNLNENGEL